jgi:hypothetical protein
MMSCFVSHAHKRAKKNEGAEDDTPNQINPNDWKRFHFPAANMLGGPEQQWEKPRQHVNADSLSGNAGETKPKRRFVGSANSKTVPAAIESNNIHISPALRRPFDHRATRPTPPTKNTMP